MSDDRTLTPPSDDDAGNRQFQDRLAELGFYGGRCDGNWGIESQEALNAFATSSHLPEDEISVELLIALFPAAEITTDPLRPLSQREDELQIPFLQAFAEAQTDPARRAALVNGLMEFGVRFMVPFLSLVQDGEPGSHAILEVMEEITVDWLFGTQLTERFDEDERRALFAIELLSIGDGAQRYQRAACKARLRLKPGHPLRDDAEIQTQLRECVANAMDAGEADAEVLARCDLVNSFPDDAKACETHLERCQALLQSIVFDEQTQQDLADTLRDSRFRYLAREAIQARDEGDEALLTDLLERGEIALAEIATSDRPTEGVGMGLLSLAMAYTARDHSRAADLFARARDETKADDPVAVVTLFREAQSRLLADKPAPKAALALLARAIPAMEMDYLTALHPSDVESAGRHLREACMDAAWAAASLDRWDEAFSYAERHKSLRLRVAAKLRSDERNLQLMEIESQLDAIRRGLTASGKLPGSPGDDATDDGHAALLDPMRAASHEETNLREQYRRELHQFSYDVVPPPRVEQVARTLAPDEAVLSFAENHTGTLLFGILPGDEATPSLTARMTDWTFSSDGSLEERDGELVGSGWLLCVHALNDMDRREPLAEFIRKLNSVLAARVGDMLLARGIAKVTVIPHGFMKLAPFWALPCLVDYDVSLALSATTLIEQRHRAVVPITHALVVADPLGDLPAARGETEELSNRLQRTQLPVQRLVTEQATESNVVANIGPGAMVHFSGHGYDMGEDPLDAGLLFHPDWQFTTVSSADAFWSVGPPSDEWRGDGSERRGLVPGVGLLREEAGQEHRQRRLVYSPTGTLMGTAYASGTTAVAECWTAGDILVGSTGISGELAMLAACRLGSGGFARTEEWTGPSAAFVLSGFPSLIASLWPVQDDVSVVFVSLFYEALESRLERRGTTTVEVDLARLVVEAGNCLRKMSKESAATRLRTMAEQASDSMAAKALWDYSSAIRLGDEHPFAHPYDWGSFYLLGRSKATFRCG